MININKKSWHYKLFKISYANPADLLSLKPQYTIPDTYNLCDYIKRVAIVAPTQILFRCGVLITCLIALGLVVWVLALPVLTKDLVAGVVFYGFSTAFFTIVYLMKKYRNRKNKSPNIIYEYYKAKKDKYCPKITFVEQDTSTEQHKH